MNPQFAFMPCGLEGECAVIRMQVLLLGFGEFEPHLFIAISRFKKISARARF